MITFYSETTHAPKDWDYRKNQAGEYCYETIFAVDGDTVLAARLEDTSGIDYCAGCGSYTPVDNSEGGYCQRCLDNGVPSVKRYDKSKWDIAPYQEKWAAYYAAGWFKKQV